jgi:colicin import membrane protein
MSSVPFQRMPTSVPPPPPASPGRVAPRRSPRPSNWPGFLAALLMHGALVGWLWFAMQWHTSAVAPAVAVLWDLPALDDTVPPPQPEPQPVNVAPPPPPAPEPVALPKPDIVQQVEKPRKPEKPVVPPKEPPPKKETKAAPSPKPSAQELRRQQQLAERQHEQEMARLTSQVGAPGKTAVISTQGRLSNAYDAKVQAAVRSNIHFAPPEGVEDSVHADYEVNLIPATGELRGEPRLVHPSGLPGWDDAVLRAILHTDPFPLREDGTAPPSFTLRVSPNDTR